MRLHPLPLLALFSSQILSAFSWETVEDAAQIARNLVDHSDDYIGTMATSFPSNDPRLPGQQFALQEYYASCHENGSLTLIFLPISRHSRNILGAEGHSASITIASARPAARKPRVSLLGNITIFEETSTVPNLKELKSCYLDQHPDAKWWLPDDDDAAHLAYWAIFDPHSIYFVGGFGDEHYIGWIPLDLYQKSGSNDASNKFLDQAGPQAYISSEAR